MIKILLNYLRLALSLRVLLVAITVFIVNACEISEPERFYNESAYPPSNDTLVFQQIKPDQYLNGTINIQLDTSLVDFEISQVQFRIADKRFDDSNYPFDFEFYTSSFSDGPHELIVSIYASKKPHGLLNLRVPPSLILSSVINIDNSSPDPVELSINTFNNKTELELNWEKSEARNFTSYILYRKRHPAEWQAIDTLLEAESTSFKDTIVDPIYGQPIDYKIMVTSNLQYRNGVESNVVNFKYGAVHSFLGLDEWIDYPIVNLNLPEVYYFDNGKIYALSSIDHSLVKTFDSFPSYVNAPMDISLIISEDGSELYLASVYGQKLFVIDTYSFTLKSEIDLSAIMNEYPWSIIISQTNQGEIILVTAEPQILKMDLTTENIISSIADENYEQIHSLISSADKLNLYFVSSKLDGNNRKYSLNHYDMNTLELKLSINLDENIQLFTNPNNQIIYSTIPSSLVDKLQIRDAESLQVVNEISNFNIEHNGMGYPHIKNDKIYLAFRSVDIFGSGSSNPGSYIVEYDLNALAPIRTWKSYNTLRYGITTSNDNVYLYVTSSFAIAL